MLNQFLNTINERLNGFDKLYCLLEYKDKPVLYSGNGNYSEIPYDNFGVGGYWRLRSDLIVNEKPSNVGCTKLQVLTYPLYFVAWYRKDSALESVEEFAENSIFTILSLRGSGVKTKVTGTKFYAALDETKKESTEWSMVRISVDIVFEKICSTTCEEIDTRCKFLGSINDEFIGEFFGDFNITVKDTEGNLVGELIDGDWVVPSADCPDGNIELNGVSVGSVASGATRDIDVLQDGLPVGSWNGTEWIVPVPEPCPVSWLLRNSARTIIQQGIINDPCEPGQGQLTLDVPDVEYIDCNGVTQQVPFPWPQTPVVDMRDCACDDVNLVINTEIPQLFEGLTGCPLELSMRVTDQDDNQVGSWVGDNYVVEIPECETLCELIAPADWPTIKACMDAPQIAAATDDLCTECPYVRPDLVDHITLSANNPFGNTKRFTGLTGGYKVGADWYDAAGVITTEALAFPFDMVLDWYGYINETVPAIEKNINTLIAGGNFNTVVTPSLAALNAAVYGGHSDWSLIDPMAGLRIGEFAASGQALNFPPFDQTVYTGISASLWSSQEFTNTPTQQYYVGLFHLVVATALKTQSRGAKAYRVYTFAELGL